MIVDISYWTRVLKRILYLAISILGIYLTFKISVFYMPFLVAFIISLIIEPAIKWIMKKLKLTRKLSAIIIFIIVSAIILGGLTWGIVTIFSEASKLLQGLNDYFDKVYSQFQNITNSINLDKIKLSDEILNVIQNSTEGVLNTISTWLKQALTGLINIVTSLPEIFICFGITILALYFICVDKVYILDQVEHHLPEIWVKKIGKHMRDLIKTLGGYLKAEATLVLVSFVISLIGLYILKFVGFKIQYPLLMAIFIGFVDALPILRFRNSYDSLGNYMWDKWRINIRNFNNNFINSDVNFTSVFRT